jgi:hypothetical protein
MERGKTMLTKAHATVALSAVLLTAGAASADRVYLKGGTVLDGEVEKKGGKVIVVGEEGTIAVPQDSVLRIEKAESAVSRFEASYAALRPGDAKGRLALADFCRANDLKARERQLLLEIIAIEPDNAAARARLGYVRTEKQGWVTEADAMRARGLVLHDGQWMSESTVRELQRMRSEVAAANRQQEEADLAKKRAQLAADQAALDAERQTRLDWNRPTYYAPYPYYSAYPYYRAGYRYGVGYPGDCYGPGGCNRPSPVHSSPGGAFDTTTLSVVKVPYRHP